MSCATLEKAKITRLAHPAADAADALAKRMCISPGVPTTKKEALQPGSCSGSAPHCRAAGDVASSAQVGASATTTSTPRALPAASERISWKLSAASDLGRADAEAADAGEEVVATVEEGRAEKLAVKESVAVEEGRDEALADEEADEERVAATVHGAAVEEALMDKAVLESNKTSPADRAVPL